MRTDNLIFLIVCLFVCFCAVGCHQAAGERTARQLIRQHVQQIAPLSREANLAYWDASTTGREEDFQRQQQFQTRILDVYSDNAVFARLQDLLDSGSTGDQLLDRQIQLLYLSYLPCQIEPDLRRQIAALDVQIQKKFNTYRPELDGKTVTTNDIFTILTSSTDSAQRKAAWLAVREVGSVIHNDLLELVRLRNRGARKLGYESFHAMTIAVNEQDTDNLDDLFATLEESTRQPYLELKAEWDRILAANCGIAVEDLRPWHYHDPFFQRTPLVYEIDLDPYYRGRDLEQIARDYFARIGLPADDILARSDLYDKPGKNPYGYSMDVDRQGDVRVLCNVVDNERWMETLLHELGHALYSKYHDPGLPYLLRQPAHAFTTEAVAMYFGRLSRDPEWMQQVLDLSDDQTAALRQVCWKYTRFQQLLFARWAMVMYHFEKELYRDPEQDLNTLWWDLVERYQFLHRPEGPADAGWASKLHFVQAPCYYHNYMLGELLASQITHSAAAQGLSAASGSPSDAAALGAYLRAAVLAPSSRYPWNEMIRRATGEPLNPAYFVQQFIE